MDYEVVVVGGGVGGLTTAALLAARGVKVCLLERQSRVGGCVADFEHLGYTFEPTAGLYAGWGAGEIHETIFSELPVKPPEVQKLSPTYSVRLPDQVELSVTANSAQFEEELRSAFPECAQAALDFYRRLDHIQQMPVRSSLTLEPTSSALTDCSHRFRGFIDLQLQTFLQADSDGCSLALAALALNPPRRGLWALRDGGQALANALTESIKKSGGALRLNTPVLRLAYGSDGLPVGVDLLSGERVNATRAVISNLTVWDTYGKLVGLSRTPRAIASELKRMVGWGAFLIFLSMDESAASRLRSPRLLALTDWREQNASDLAPAQFVFAAGVGARAPEGKIPVTVSAFTHVDDWFVFHNDETEHEAHDQAMLESLWSRLHTALPELGDSVEVIETATPRTFYEDTRRKLGMIGRPTSHSNPEAVSARSHFPNLFLVGDTVSPGIGLAGLFQSALELANLLTNRL